MGDGFTRGREGARARGLIGLGIWPITASSCPGVSRAATLILTATLVLAAGLGAAEGPGVDLRAEPASVAVGEPVTLHVTYRWPTATPPAAAPNPSVALDGELITAIDGPRTTTAGGSVTQRWSLRLVMQRSGTWAAPRLSLRLPGAEEPLRAPEVLVEVGTGGAPPALSPPSALWVPTVDEPRAAGAWWPWLLGGGTLLVVLAALAWALLRRRPESGPTPAERFAQALPRARAADDGKLAGALLSSALRRYCGERWGFDGAAATDVETVTHLGGKLPSTELGALRRLLDHLEGLRWSPEALARASVQPLIDQAGAWVDEQERRLLAEAEAEVRRGQEAAA